MIGIYQIHCSATGKVYIGRSSDINERILGHLYILRKGTHYNRELQLDFNTFGESTFSCKVLKILSENDNEKLATEEQFFISGFDPSQLYTKRNSNSGAFADSITEDTRKKLGDRQKGDKNHFYGKKHNAAKISEMKTNNPASRNEVKDKIRAYAKLARIIISPEGVRKKVLKTEIPNLIKEGWKPSNPKWDD